VIRDLNVPIRLARVPTCVRLDAYAVRCSAVRQLDVDLGDGPDVATIATPREVSLEGGAGNDRYVSLAGDAPSRVDFEGGVGLDVANYFFATSGVRVSVDLEAADGRPGDDDRIRRDVESVLGSQFADVPTGSPRTVQLAGHDGDDEIAGGSGAEALSGGLGNDRVDARDGAPDTVDCGGQLLDWAAVDVGAEASVIGCANTNDTEEDR
jgi:Ca2+-binding RTX toxin-like protein